MGLYADNFHRDPRIKKAKKLILDALKEHQQEIINEKKSREALKKDYAKLIDECSRLRGGSLYFPYLGSGFGKGPLVELADGSIKYDFIGGIGVYFLGHNSVDLTGVLIDAALENTVMQGNLQQNTVTKDVLELFVKAASRNGAPLHHCFLTSSGAMANENALKIVFQRKFPAKRILAFRNCFSGRTLVMSQITDKEKYREGLPKVLDVDYVPFFDPHNPKESIRLSVEVLNKHLALYPNDHAGMIFELIQGEGGGYCPGSKEFFTELMKILKEKNVAVIVDEIQTFGRTSELFAFQHFGLDKFIDVVTVGKLTQACATLFTDDYKPKAGLISQTFTTSTSALYAARMILRRILKKGVFGKDGRVMKMNNYFHDKIKGLSYKNPDLLQGPFGYGGMVAMTCFDGSMDASKLFLKELFDNGVIAFSAGENPVRVRFLLPVMALTKKNVNRAVHIIEKTLIDVQQKIISGKEKK